MQNEVLFDDLHVRSLCSSLHEHDVRARNNMKNCCYRDFERILLPQKYSYVEQKSDNTAWPAFCNFNQDLMLLFRPLSVSKTFSDLTPVWNLDDRIQHMWCHSRVHMLAYRTIDSPFSPLAESTKDIPNITIVWG